MSSSEDDVLHALAVLASCNMEAQKGLDPSQLRLLAQVKQVVNDVHEGDESKMVNMCQENEACEESMSYLEQRNPGLLDTGLLQLFSKEILRSDHMLASLQGSFAAASAAVDGYGRQKRQDLVVVKSLKKQIEREYIEVSQAICGRVLDGQSKVLDSGVCRSAVEKPIHITFTMPERCALSDSVRGLTTSGSNLSIQAVRQTDKYNCNVVALLPKDNTRINSTPRTLYPQMNTSQMALALQANSSHQPSKQQSCPLLRNSVAISEHLRSIYKLQKPYPYYALQVQLFSRATAAKLPLYTPLPVSIQSMFPNGSDLLYNLEISHPNANNMSLAQSSTLSRCLSAATTLPLALYSPPALLGRNNIKEPFLSWYSHRVNTSDTTLVTAQLMEVCGLRKQDYEQLFNAETRSLPNNCALAPVPRSFQMVPTSSLTDLATILPQMMHHSQVCTGVDPEPALGDVEKGGSIYDMTKLAESLDHDVPPKRTVPKPVAKREQVKKQLQTTSRRNGVIGDWDVLSFGPGAQLEFKFVPKEWIDGDNKNSGGNDDLKHALSTVTPTEEATIQFKTCQVREADSVVRLNSLQYPAESPCSLSLTSVPSFANQDAMKIDSTLLVPLSLHVEAGTNSTAATIPESLQIHASVQEHDLRAANQLNQGEQTMIPVSLEVSANTTKTVAVPLSHFQVWHGTGEAVNNTTSYYVSLLDTCIQQHIRDCSRGGCSTVCANLIQAYHLPSSDAYCDLLLQYCQEIFSPANPFATLVSLNAASARADKVALETALLHSVENQGISLSDTTTTNLGVDGLLNIVRSLPIEDNMHIEVALTGPVQLRGDAPLSCYEQSTYRGLQVKLISVLESPQLLLDDDDDERKLRELQYKEKLDKMQIVDLYKEQDETALIQRLDHFLFGNRGLNTALPSPNEENEQVAVSQPPVLPPRTTTESSSVAKHGFFRDLLQEPRKQITASVNGMITGATGSIMDMFGVSHYTGTSHVAVSPASNNTSTEQQTIVKSMRHAPSLTIEAIASFTPMPIEIAVNRQSSQQLAVHSIFTNKVPALPSLKFMQENKEEEEKFLNARKYESAACICLTCRLPSICASCAMKCHYKHRMVKITHLNMARSYIKCCAALTELYQNRYIDTLPVEWVWPPGGMLPKQAVERAEIHNLTLLSVAILVLLHSAKVYTSPEQAAMYLESVPSLSAKSRALALQLPDWALYTNYDSDILHHRILPKVLSDVYRASNDKQEKYGQKTDLPHGLDRIKIDNDDNTVIREETPTLRSMRRCLCDGGCGWPALLQPWSHVNEDDWDGSTLLLRNRRCMLFSCAALSDDPVHQYEQDDGVGTSSNLMSGHIPSTISTLPHAPMPAPALEPKEALSMVRRQRTANQPPMETVYHNSEDFDDLDSVWNSSPYNG